VTRFDSTDLDRLFHQLRTDLPDDGFSARLHAALLADSVPETAGRWSGWGRRVGAGVALAAIPLAAAAATLSGWTPPWTRATETEPSQVAAPTGSRWSPVRRARPSGSLALQDDARAEVEVASDEAAAPGVSRSTPEPVRPSAAIAVETDEPVPTSEPTTGQDGEATNPPRVERVRLNAKEPDDPAERGAGTSLDQNPRTASAATTEAQSRTNRSGAAARSDREVARERRQRDAVPERERRQLGPRVAR
jgi:hypothetical protein